MNPSHRVQSSFVKGLFLVMTGLGRLILPEIPE